MLVMQAANAYIEIHKIKTVLTNISFTRRVDKLSKRNRVDNYTLLVLENPRVFSG